MSTLADESTTEITDDWIPRHRLTVDEYYRMAEVGLLAPDAQVELIQGEIIDMVPVGSRHAAAVIMLTDLLVPAAGKLAFAVAQSPIRLDQYSEPQPDFVLLKRREDYYAERLPDPDDVLLLIEVSNSTLRYDRSRKIPLYARHSIAEVWLIDLQRKQLHQFRQPLAGVYQESRIFKGGQIELPLEPSVTIEITDLLNL